MIDMTKKAMVKYDQKLENCTAINRVFYSAHKGGETRMSSKEIRRRIEIGGNKVWIRANSEQEYADKIIERYRESIGAEEQSGHNFRVFAEKWFEVFKEPNVRKGSQMSYRRQLDVHIYPILGEKDIEDIRACFKTLKLTKVKCKREKQPHESRRLFSHTA